jgi:hypothetical protein
LCRPSVDEEVSFTADDGQLKRELALLSRIGFEGNNGSIITFGTATLVGVNIFIGFIRRHVEIGCLAEFFANGRSNQVRGPDLSYSQNERRMTRVTATPR